MSDKEKIRKIIVTLFAEMGFTVDPKTQDTTESGCIFSINTDQDAQFLIGHQGANLSAIEHLVRIAARQQGINFHFKIDINDYCQKKEKMFEMIATDAAQEVMRTKRPLVLKPMNPYERRLIHMHLADDKRVTTDSIGTDSQRKVVVKPLAHIDTL